MMNFKPIICAIVISVASLNVTDNIAHAQKGRAICDLYFSTTDKTIISSVEISMVIGEYLRREFRAHDKLLSVFIANGVGLFRVAIDGPCKDNQTYIDGIQGAMKLYRFLETRDTVR